MKSLALILLAAAGASSLARAEVVEIVIGETTIQVPVEDGYLAGSTGAPGNFEVAQAALPTTNRLVELFHTPENLARLNAGEDINGHYFMIQSMRSLESSSVSMAEWTAGRPQLKQGMDQGFAAVNDTRVDPARDRRMSEAAGRALAMRFGELQTPTIYAETADSVRFLLRIPVEFTVGEGGEAQQQGFIAGAAGTVMMVRGKVLFLYWYAIPATPESMDAARAKLDAVVDGVVALNAPAGSAAAGSADAAGDQAAATRGGQGGFDWGRVGIKALGGALIGVLLFGVFWLRARRKRTGA